MQASNRWLIAAAALVVVVNAEKVRSKNIGACSGDANVELEICYASLSAVNSIPDDLPQHSSYTTIYFRSTLLPTSGRKSCFDGTRVILVD